MAIEIAPTSGVVWRLMSRVQWTWGGVSPYSRLLVILSERG